MQKLASLGEKQFSVIAYGHAQELQEALLIECPNLARGCGFEYVRASDLGGNKLLLIDIPHG